VVVNFDDASNVALSQPVVIAALVPEANTVFVKETSLLNVEISKSADCLKVLPSKFTVSSNVAFGKYASSMKVVPVKLTVFLKSNRSLLVGMILQSIVESVILMRLEIVIWLLLEVVPASKLSNSSGWQWTVTLEYSTFCASALLVNLVRISFTGIVAEFCR